MILGTITNVVKLLILQISRNSFNLAQAAAARTIRRLNSLFLRSLRRPRSRIFLPHRATRNSPRSRGGCNSINEYGGSGAVDAAWAFQKGWDCQSNYSDHVYELKCCYQSLPAPTAERSTPLFKCGTRAMKVGRFGRENLPPDQHLGRNTAICIGPNRK
jgi:hypothetical protein